ncbi:MAG: VOC family protein [Chloroflexi bacterium]|nr:VOC family protein [Chloroflexota bacterium]
MAVKKLQNAYYVTKDMDRAVAFYRDALGLPIKFQDGAKWAQFDAGGVNFSISSPEEAAGEAAGAVVIFEVDDIDASRTALEQAGASVLDTRDMGSHGRSLTFKDPDGNLVQLFQRASG